MRRSFYVFIPLFLILGTFLWLYTSPSSLRQEFEAWKPSSTRIYPPPTDLLSEKPVEVEEPTVDSSHDPVSIEEIWRDNWAKAFVEARPLAPKIELSSIHGNNGVAAADTDPRAPAKNRVKNGADDLMDLQLAHASLLKSLATIKTGEGLFKGRGIVTVGGLEYYGPAIIGIHMLRSTGFKEPVEVFVADQAEYEEDICDDYLLKLNARCIVIADILDAETTETPPVTHYQLKSLAILFSSFQDVLYLDSDSIPLVNPSTELFDAEPYISSGLVSWPDFWAASESPSFYTIAGIPFPKDMPKRSSEAGQLLINKKTHIKTLLLATYYNLYGPNHYYPLLSQGALGQGDKETFLAAAVVLNETYYRVKTPVNSVNRFNGALKISGMVQHHPVDGRPAFLHANTPKANAGHLVDEGDLIKGKTHIRLWGKQEEQIKQFGRDLEKEVWELLVSTGCKLADTIQEWKNRKNMCGKLKEHWDAVFATSK